MNELLKREISLLPNKPGCYQMFDKDNNIIYVGKAKNLKNRLNSYNSIQDIWSCIALE